MKLSHAKILLILVIISFTLRIALISQDIETILSKFMTDDSFYAYDVAYNVANGKGITFNDGVPTNGFTVVYTIGVLPPLVKLFYPIGINAPIYASLVVLSLFTVGTGAILYLICSKLLNKTAGLFAAFIWLFNPYVLFVSLMALESPILIFFIALLSWLIIKYNTTRLSTKKSFIIGVILGLLFLTRMDSIFLGIGLIGTIIIRKLFNKTSIFSLFKQKDLYVIILTASLVVSPWLIWSYLNVGRITPHSSEAGDVIDKIRYIDTKDFTYTGLRLNVVHSFGGFVSKFFYLPVDSTLIGGIIILSFLIIPGVFLLVKRDDILKILIKLDFLLVSTVFYYLFYIIRATGLREWYSLHTSLIISILFPLILFQVSKRFVRPNIIISVVIAILITSFIYGGLLHYARGNCPWCIGSYKMGVYATQNIPPTETIAAFGAGIIQYYALNHDVINLDGVVNPLALQALKDDTMDKFVLENNISYVIDTPGNWFYTVLFDKPSIKYEEYGDFITEYWSYKKEDSGMFVYKIFKIQPANS